jgi:hypothetical protein
MNKDVENNNLSVCSLILESNVRNLKKVPFVEMTEGRLQGVTSSGSDIERVYVSYIRTDNHNYYCSTNNNRPCGGLRGSVCKHLTTMIEEAIKQYGMEQVLSYLRLNVDPKSIKKGKDLLKHLKGEKEKEPISDVFSRFLTHLHQLELAGSNKPIPEMDWFILLGGDR